MEWFIFTFRDYLYTVKQEAVEAYTSFVTLIR